MDTITILGIAALAGIFASWRAEAKRERAKPSRAASTPESPSLLTPEENLFISSPAPTTAESPPVLTAEERIFISHPGTNQELVETLARNLNKMGYLVFWDILETATKQPVDFEGQKALPNHTILVVTPETIESGWVREEYELILKRQEDKADFTVIPVVFNDVLSDSPFLSDREVINFSAEKYQGAFHQLVSHFTPKPFDDKDLELPPPTIAPTVPITSDTREFIKTRLTHFEQNSPPPLILLAQRDRNQAPMVEALLTEAKTRYQVEHCLHIALPYSLENDIPNYFALLAQQSGLRESVNNGIEFEQALLTRLKKQSTPLFLVISRFEHGPQAIRQKIAGMVRSLNESHANQLHIILCGGEKLAELKYPHQSSSVLNTAEINQWPELTRSDVYAMQDQFEIELALDEKSADQLLLLSGRHPILLQKALQLLQSEPTLEWQDYPVALSHEPFVWRLFTAFQQAEQVREWLAQEKVAPSSVLFSYDHQRNDLLRRLYWNNLLVEQPVKGRKYLCWRCEALRLAGQEILTNFGEPFKS